MDSVTCVCVRVCNDQNTTGRLTHYNCTLLAGLIELSCFPRRKSCAVSWAIVRISGWPFAFSDNALSCKQRKAKFNMKEAAAARLKPILSAHIVTNDTSRSTKL